LDGNIEICNKSSFELYSPEQLSGPFCSESQLGLWTTEISALIHRVRSLWSLQPWYLKILLKMKIYGS